MTMQASKRVAVMIENALKRFKPDARALENQLIEGPQGPLPPGGNTEDGYSPAAHDLTGDRHTASGLTTGQPLRATSATAFDFGPLNLALTAATTNQLLLSRGGTGADLSATGGSNQVVQQTSSGGALTVGQLNLNQLTGTISDSQHGNRGGGSLHDLATNLVAGFMSAAQFIKVGLIDNPANANTFFAGPSTGLPGSPTFRAMATADIPTLDASKIGSGTLARERGGTGVSNSAGSLAFNGVTSITGGGTLALGGFTLTAPANGTTVLGGGALASTRIPYGTDANTLTSEAGFEYIAADNEARIGQWRSPEISTPSTPTSGFGTFFTNTSGVGSHIDDAGVVREMGRNVALTSFTPAFGGSGGGGSFTYSQQIGRYTRKWEEEVKVWIRLTINTFTSAPSGNLRVTGLPFTSANVANLFYAAVIGYRNTGLNSIVTAVIPANATHIEFYDTSGGIVPASVMSATSYIVLQATYPI